LETTLDSGQDTDVAGDTVGRDRQKNGERLRGRCSQRQDLSQTSTIERIPTDVNLDRFSGNRPAPLRGVSSQRTQLAFNASIVVAIRTCGSREQVYLDLFFILHNVYSYHLQVVFLVFD
jgi:hypothetical protein